MAGRLYISPTAPDALLLGLHVDMPLLSGANRAPRNPVSMIRQRQQGFGLTTAFWGLTPPWLKVLDHAPHCARAESLASRDMFREAFGARRCLIPASGVYLWKPQPRFKQPFLVTRADRGPLLLAGLWCRYHTTLTAHHDSTALITVATNTLLAPLSDRFPAVIAPADAPAWLDPATPMGMVERMLMPAPLELLGAFPVSRRVNDPLDQDWGCAHPTGPMLRWTTSQET
ncbi:MULTISPECIES: SOS response-associated peptidase [Halomonadaceae]|uniref:SOS response-associated peptidase n=1 Tax=Halomonadaceae TaxID=28256 RepID=UPI00159B7328|nr:MULTISPECIES: SOS response-associated peptidase [Halomonas]QJQ94616.1 SOS response-associated peptidase [Halomonas sp. PA5]